MRRRDIKFEVTPEFELNLGTQGIGSIYKINKYDYMASTLRELVRFDNNGIKGSYPYKFLTSCFMDNYGFVAGISVVGADLIILQLDHLRSPAIPRYPTNHLGVFHMAYSRKSSAIIVFGSGIKVWTVKVIAPNIHFKLTEKDISITMRSSFCPEYESPLLNPPEFDKESNLILLPTSQGITAYNLDGQKIKLLTKLPCSTQTIFSFQPESRRILTVEPTRGVVLWDKHAAMQTRFNVGSSILSVRFVNRENAIYVNTKGCVSILDIKTQRSFIVHNLEGIPSRIFVLWTPHPVFVACFAGKIIFHRVNIPWRVWAKNVHKPVSLMRVNKLNAAARIAVFTGNSFVKLYSPKDGKLLTSATPFQASSPHSFYYDRGTVMFRQREQRVLEQTAENGRDQLFIVLENGILTSFSTGMAPCDQTNSMELKIDTITTAKWQGNWVYALGSSKGDVTFADYKTLKLIRRVVFGQKRLISVVYLPSTEEILMIYDGSLLLMETQKGRKISEINFEGTNLVSVNDNIIYFGYKTGQIVCVSYENHVLNTLNTDIGARYHNAAVTSFAFADTFWVSSSMDQTVMIWDYNFTNICTIYLPLPIFACTILNGHRDIIVGTETEVMIIKGRRIFEGIEDDEVKEIDNYDRLDDVLIDQCCNIGDFEEEEEENLLGKQFDEEITQKPVEVVEWAPIDPNLLKPPKAAIKKKETISEEDEAARRVLLEEMEGMSNKREISLPSRKSARDNEKDGNGNDEEDNSKDGIEVNLEVKEKKKKPKKDKEKKPKRHHRPKNEESNEPKSDNENENDNKIKEIDDSELFSPKKKERKKEEKIEEPKERKPRANAPTVREDHRPKRKIVPKDDGDSKNEIEEEENEENENGNNGNGEEEEELADVEDDSGNKEKKPKKKKAKSDTVKVVMEPKEKKEGTSRKKSKGKKRKSEEKKEKIVSYTQNVTLNGDGNRNKNENISKGNKYSDIGPIKPNPPDFDSKPEPPSSLKDPKIPVKGRNFKRPPTPPLKVKKAPYRDPTPGIVIDSSKVFKEFMNGRTELIGALQHFMQDIENPELKKQMERMIRKKTKQPKVSDQDLERIKSGKLNQAEKKMYRARLPKNVYERLERGELTKEETFEAIKTAQSLGQVKVSDDEIERMMNGKLTKEEENDLKYIDPKIKEKINSGKMTRDEAERIIRNVKKAKKNHLVFVDESEIVKAVSGDLSEEERREFARVNPQMAAKLIEGSLTREEAIEGLQRVKQGEMMADNVIERIRNGDLTEQEKEFFGAVLTNEVFEKIRDSSNPMPNNEVRDKLKTILTLKQSDLEQLSKGEGGETTRAVLSSVLPHEIIEKMERGEISASMLNEMGVRRVSETDLERLRNGESTAEEVAYFKRNAPPGTYEKLLNGELTEAEYTEIKRRVPAYARPCNEQAAKFMQTDFSASESDFDCEGYGGLTGDFNTSENESVATSQPARFKRTKIHTFETECNGRVRIETIGYNGPNPLSLVTVLRVPEKKGRRVEIEDDGFDEFQRQLVSDEERDGMAALFEAIKKSDQTKVVSARVVVKRPKTSAPLFFQGSKEDLLEREVSKFVPEGVRKPPSIIYPPPVRYSRGSRSPVHTLRQPPFSPRAPPKLAALSASAYVFEEKLLSPKRNNSPRIAVPVLRTPKI